MEARLIESNGLRIAVEGCVSGMSLVVVEKQ